MPANTTSRPQTVESNYQFGRHGAVMVAASSAQTSKDYSAVQFLAEGTFSAFTGTSMTGTWTSVTIPAGTVIYGHITAYTASVATIAYNDLQFS
jgi:hypothetical protein